MKPIIGYRRCSTEGQGKSGLGLEAQDTYLASYAKMSGGQLLKVFTEVESGKRSDNRPELQKAIAHAKRSGAVLAVAVLDRLSRNSYFINMLLEKGVEFVDCQSPHDTPFITRIKAAVAQEELEKISKRTKDALAAYKARGGKLGSKPGTCPIPIEARRKGAKLGGAVMAKNAREAYSDLLPAIAQWRADGLSQKQIADRLNSEGFTTSTGGIWHQGHVCQLIKRMSS